MKTRRARSFVALAVTLALQAGAGLLPAGAAQPGRSGPTWSTANDPEWRGAAGAAQPGRSELTWSTRNDPECRGAAGAGAPAAGTTTAAPAPASATTAVQAAGQAWTAETTPLIADGSQLDAVRCPAAAACIAVGAEYTAGTSQAVAERWKGTTWSQVPLPLPAGSRASILTGLSCASTSSCEAVGYYQTTSNVEVTLAEAWNGTTWSLQSTPSLSGAAASAFGGVSCPTTTQCTAAGDEVGSAGEVSLAEAGNGQRWSTQATPSPSGSAPTLSPSPADRPPARSCSTRRW